MYRIELTPGEVTVFRTIEELATGVRNGLITPKARIYHSASDKWLPIEFHPHYKQALELNATHADPAGNKHGIAGSKHTSPKHSSPKHSSKHSSPKGAASKPRNEGLTFLNVPLSPVTPLPRPKPRGADLPYIEDAPAASHEQPARPSPDPSASHAPAPERVAIEHSPVYERPAEFARPGSPSMETTPHVEHPAPHRPRDEHAAADQSSTTAKAVNDATVGRSPGYDLDDEPSVDQPATHQPEAQPAAQHAAADEVSEREDHEFGAPAHDTPAHVSPVERGAAAYDAAPTHHQSFNRMLADETPVYRSPAQRSAHHEAEAHAAFEAHLPAEPIRIEEPIHDAPRSRLAVEELFAPPPPRAPALPPVSASPVLELPQISYPEFTPAEPPVAERSSGGSRVRRSLHLVGAVLLLAAGGYASTMVFSFGRSDSGFNAASTMADRPVVPVRTRPPSPAPSRDTAPPSSTVEMRGATTPSAPARPELRAPSAPLPPASSGFAPALEPRAIVNIPLKPASKPDAVTDSGAIAPAIDMQVAVPDLQVADSLTTSPPQKSDSAMKRILRAVSGKKDAQ